jgi:guanosine-3',5'-bis(diphosphate) 3'-pyrophosphohydrolase
MSLAQIEEKHYKKLNELLELCKKNLHTYDESLIRRAFMLSYSAHADAKRASGEPYFYHPIEVAKILLTEIPLDDISVAAALLHDVVEDTDYTIEDVRDEFGENVANIVNGLTKISDIFKNREIKEAESFRKMLLSMTNDIRVMLVKFADRLHNMRTLDHLPPQRQLKTAIETRDIYAPFANRFGLGKIKWELEDLSFKYIDREAYDDIVAKINLKRTERLNYMERFSKPIEKHLKKHGFDFEISRRPKHLYSIYTKMRTEDKTFDEIYDLYGIRVILNTANPSDCFAAYGYVTQIYPPVPERFKDYISVPKNNGYQSLHTTLVGPDGHMVEIQIRTQKMHEFAENGVAAHWKYKEKISSTDTEFESLIKWIRELVDQAGESPTAFMENFQMNLYQDEIYIFTPKGDMKILPKAATPVDFAFEIHTQVGTHCIGAKVNGRIVALNHKLKSGDQVEIITSKNQTPKSDWEKFAVTHRAKAKIRQWVNEERRGLSDAGRELWDKFLKRTKKTFDDPLLQRLAHNLGFSSTQAFMIGLANDQFDVDEAVESFEERTQKEKEILPQGEAFENFVKEARTPGGLTNAPILGGLTNIAYSYAKCCNPVPGDEVIGLVTAAGEVRIHRKNCRNINNETIVKSEKVISVDWKKSETEDFISGIRILGEDKIGMTNAITHVISKSCDTNIRSITLNAKDGMFEGTVIVYVKDLNHLNKLTEKLKRIEGVFSVERFSQ